MKNRPFFTLITSFILFCTSCSENTEELNVLDIKNEPSSEYIRLNDGSYAEKTPYGYMVEGDILLSDSIFNYLTSPQTRGAYDKNVTYWPNGVVYYKINSNITNPSVIYNAINKFHEYTYLDFIQSDTSGHYIEFILGNELHSSLGMTSGDKQYVNISSGSTDSKVIHEIGHALGLIHEHTRPDRDDYIIVNTNNIAPGKENQFLKKDFHQVGISKEKYLLESWETNNLSNPINVNSLSDGEYRLVVEKDNCKSEQTLTINKQS